MDFSITDALYLRGECLYAPDFSSFLPEINVIEINRANSLAWRFALGWQPGAAKSSKQKSASEKTGQTQTNKTQPSQYQTNQPQTNQPQPSQPKEDSQSANNKDGWNIANVDTARNVQYLSALEKDII
ncbi:hypothetical protein, partial [Treponema sp. R8-4-B8]